MRVYFLPVRVLAILMRVHFLLVRVIIAELIMKVCFHTLRILILYNHTSSFL